MPRTSDRAAPRRLVFSNAHAVTVVPWDKEPKHKHLLTCATTRVYEARLAPGDVTLFHSHDADHTAYIVASPEGGATVLNEVATGGDGSDPPEPQTMTVTAGDTFSFCCRDGALIHRISVPADQVAGPHFVGIEVHPRVRDRGAAPTPFLPPPFETTVDADTFFVSKLKLPPGASVPPFAAPAAPAVAVVVTAPKTGVSGSGPIIDAGTQSGGFALWEGGGGDGAEWSVRNEGDGELECGVVVWK